MASSCSPSSSAVTIPTPGKSILKKPAPTQQSIFSRFIRILPTQGQASNALEDEAKPLKRAHFILPQLTTIYPISSLAPPSTSTSKEEKKAIEEREAERRRRVVRGNSVSSNEAEDWWSIDKVESFYRECCAGTDEVPDPAISAAFKRAVNTNPRSVDLSGVQLTDTSATILSDVFTIEWGLRKLVFRECNLDEQKLKPILHALLIPGTLSFLSVASNRRLKAPAFRLIGAFLYKAKCLQFLDLSQIPLDKKSIEYIVASLALAPSPGLVSLRLDDCSIRPAALETLAHAVRTSSLRNISLRHNRITSTGAVALALMIKDYPDVYPSGSTPPTSVPSSPSSSNSSLPPVATSFPEISNPQSPASPRSPPARSGPILPPPRHPAAAGHQTTYTPYIPKTRRAALAAQAPNPLSPSGQPIPIITSSSQGGITTRHPVNLNQEGTSHPHPSGHNVSPRHDHGPSAALLDKVRALDNLPRLGALRTLDLKGNDLRAGITYLSLVLKRNRTLKVLNLSENKLDVQCLVSVAEALKYNSCLETLDLSKNPCSGPGLEGIQSLRTAFTLNTALKRLFLSSTAMTSIGAIALAEFLPESSSLLHLDLTLNDLDIAAVMALSSGLKANHTMRCLDLNIPPDDEEFAKMCREILNSCVRNTEEAERNSNGSATASKDGSGKGLSKGVWGMIEESELAKTFRQGDNKQGQTDLIIRARSCISQLSDATSTTLNGDSPDMLQESPVDLRERAQSIASELAAVIQTTTDSVGLGELLSLNDSITSLLVRASPHSGGRGLKLQGLGLDLATPQNGHAPGSLEYALGSPSEHPNAESPSEDEDVPVTPRIDKGKGRAEPEPAEPEKVLSPSTNFSISDSEDEEDDTERPSVTSPTDRSRSWVAEEGEVFRKGTVLLGPEEMEGEYAGEELRKELLEAMVERPPPRPLVDEFGLEANSNSESVPSTPVQQEDPKKPPPLPYISRSRSSSSLLSSPTTPTATTPTALVGKEGLTSPSSASPTLSQRPFLSRNRSSQATVDMPHSR